MAQVTTLLTRADTVQKVLRRQEQAARDLPV